MTRRILLLLGFLLAAAAGCASHAPQGPIDFEVTGGFTGGGDGTPTLRIDPDGTMTRHTAGGVTQTATLDRATLADLRGKVYAAEFATLSPMYSSCADCYVYVVSVQLDATTYKVAADQMAEVPGALDAVIGLLKDISQRPLDWH